jgi:hypothetical protein
LTTFISYGSVAGERQADILNELSRKTVDGVDSGEPDETTIRRVLGYAQEGVLVRNYARERPDVDCWYICWYCLDSTRKNIKSLRALSC